MYTNFWQFHAFSWILIGRDTFEQIVEVANYTFFFACAENVYSGFISFGIMSTNQITRHSYLVNESWNDSWTARTFCQLLVNNGHISFCSFLGVGYAQVISTGIVATYYVTIMAITLHYFFNSFKAILPWTECLPKWGNTCTPSSRDTAFKYIKQSLVNRSSSAELYYE